MSGHTELIPPMIPVAPPKYAQDVYQGWVLKKRRKKMQGFARRYFVLKHDGVLVYSTHPGSNPRDSIPLRLATITSSERSRQITVDSGTKTFHIKCLSAPEFDKWMTAFRTFLVQPDQLLDAVDEEADAHRPQPGRALSDFSNRLTQVTHDMGASLQELERLIAESEPSQEERDAFAAQVTKKKSIPNIRSRKDKDEREHHLKGDHGSGIFGLFHRRTSNNSAHASETSPSDTYSAQSPSLSASAASTPSTSTFPASSWPSTMGNSPSSGSMAPAMRQLQMLRAQHTALLSILKTLPSLATSSANSSMYLSTHAEVRESLDSKLSTPRASAVDRIMTTQHSSGALSMNSPRSPRSVRSRASFVPHRRPLSVNTVASAEDSVFFDAEDGGLEFIDIDDQTRDDRDSDDSDSEDSAREAARTIGRASVSQSRGSGEDREGAKTPEAQRPSGLSVDVTPRPELGSVLSNVSSSSTVSLGPHSVDEPQTPIGKTIVVRRKQLPAPTSGEQVSLFTMLKRNIGKDLSTVAFPVSFNEPLSLLQHAAEDLEYTDVLEKAVEEKDPIARLAFVAAFAVSGYACTKLRASRKPFNPLLGETFEDVRYNFVSEKVSHHPPVIACHAHGDGWEFWGTSGAKNKFWGKSLEIIPVGTSYLKIGDETYSWQKPSSFMRNLIAGEKYLEHCGFMNINTSSASLQCTLEFKEGGFWGTGKDEVLGKIVSPDNRTDVELRGRWNVAMSRLLDASGSHLHVLWRATPLPDDAPEYYGFTKFAIGLNEITEDIRDYIPPTDSRLRPDQRALEDGDIDRAEEEKARVEEAQRERRRDRAGKNITWQPKWFRPKEGSPSEWEYAGGYWEAREKRQWGELEKLW